MRAGSPQTLTANPENFAGCFTKITFFQIVFALPFQISISRIACAPNLPEGWDCCDRLMLLLSSCIMQSYYVKVSDS